MSQDQPLKRRPREWDRDLIADELIEWAKLDTSVNLNGFCASKLMPAQKLSQFANECSQFREAYHIAKTILSERRESKLSKQELHVKAYDLNARVYDHFLDEKHTQISKAETQQAVDAGTIAKNLAAGEHTQK